jgi:RHS repeat-associated protein
VANADVATTTYSYDANGNLIQAGGWSYMWDYLNRMLASGYNNSTTTYAYDPSGARVLQTSTTSTTYYPNKFYSFSSMLAGGTTYATSTNYIWNGDTLLATIDQKLINGAVTGSPITRYIHPDHLGSTNVVTDASGTVVQLMDYYPYGATRIATSTYPTNEKRQYIGQFSDAQTNLNYLNARYYDGQRGQFVSQDPVFLANPKNQHLRNPQSLNSYSYANDNPIVNKDPDGEDAATASAAAPSAASAAVAIAALLTRVRLLLAIMLVLAVVSTVSQSVTPSVVTTPATPAPIVLPIQTPAPSYGGSTTFFPQSTPQSRNLPFGSSILSPVNFFTPDQSRIILPSPDDLRGKSKEEIDEIMKNLGLKGEPSRGGGVRYPVPGQTGDQVRIENGHPNDEDATKQGPYGRVSQNGQTSDPFPIEGNPELDQ